MNNPKKSLSNKSGQAHVTERSLMFAYVRLKSLMFAYFEKNVFFSGVVVGIFGHTTGGGYDG